MLNLSAVCNLIWAFYINFKSILSTKKLLSYVVPLVLKEGKTSLGQHYEVNFENGVKVLNSSNTNYSFGSLHQIMLKGIDEVLRYHKVKRVLMLGLGAGSALSVLKNKCHWSYKVTAVELDADLITIAREHFELDQYTELTMINGDASVEVHALPTAAFDCIIDDVFLDDQVPGFCRDHEYIKACRRLLEPGGIYMRNVMAHGFNDMKAYESALKSYFSDVYSIKHKTYGNRIYFCKA